jgi:hypothetical protein
VLRPKNFRDLEVLIFSSLSAMLLLLHRAVVAHDFLFRTPFDPNKLSTPSFHRPPLLETWSQQKSAMNSLRIRGRRSASVSLWLLLLGPWPQAYGGY